MNMQFTKSHNHLICIDSDGCAIDGMTIKHQKCFGPAFIEEFGLERYCEELLSYWNKINLYEKTRGINRFKGLHNILLYAISRKMLDMDVTPLSKWVSETKELSNRSLQCAYVEQSAPILEKALHWSERVNSKIDGLKCSEKCAFPGVRETLRLAHAQAEIAVISAANAAAVDQEWSYNGLLETVDIKMTQEYGNKESCIHLLKELGYHAHNIVMLGDAPGDLMAAQENGILFYPIVVNQEVSSWEIFRESVLPAFLCGMYTQEMMNTYVRTFLDNLQCKNEMITDKGYDSSLMSEGGN